MAQTFTRTSTLHSMDVALTGCTGFLGTYLTRALSEAGHQVTGLVRPGRSTEHLDADLIHRIVGDLTDGPALRRLADSADVVIHNAFDAVADQPLRHFRSNVLGSLQLLEFARQSPGTQFIFISTAQVFHDILPDRLLDEHHPVRPGDLDSAVKAAIEPFVSAYYETYGMNVCALRPGRIYGVHPELAKSWAYDVINTVTLGEPVDTSAGAHVVNVDDVTEAVVRAVGNYAVAGQVYNLVDDYVCDQDVAEIAKEMTGSPSVIHDRRNGRGRHHFVAGKTPEVLGVDVARGVDGIREYVRAVLDQFS